LAEIDTPESKQPWGTRARQALADKAFRKEARVVVDTDRYGRIMGRARRLDRPVRTQAAWGGLTRHPARCHGDAHSSFPDPPARPLLRH